MVYRAVTDRCAVDFADLQLSFSVEQSLEILDQKGFQHISVDLVPLARSLVGIAQYRRGARLSEAPHIFDCSSFIKWLYGQKGIWLPRRSIQQREFGTPVNPCDIQAGDIVFISGFIDYYHTDPRNGVGHVGLATGENTVIHAANRKVGVIESPYTEFAKDNKLRGIQRIVPENRQVYTFLTPPEREIEWSDDIRWIILQNVPR
jgi:hypothetical protein